MPTNQRELTLGVLFTAKLGNVLNQTRKLSKTIDDIGSSSKKTSSSMGGLQKGLRGIGDESRRTGNALGGLLGKFKLLAEFRGLSAIQNAFIGGANAIVEFDQSLANTKAIAEETDTTMSILGDKMLDLSNKTKFSSAELGAGLQFIAQAGFEGIDAMTALEASSALASGTMSDLADTSDLITTSIRAFNLETSESARVADTMANAVNKSKLTINKLSTSFNYVGASSAQAGIKLEETATVLGLLANNGLKASTSATGFRQVIARLLAPTAKLKKAFTDYGIRLEDVDLKSKSLKEVMTKVREILHDTETNTIKVDRAFELFGLRGAQAATVIAKSIGGVNSKYDVMLKQMKRTGTAQQMAEVQAEGLGFKLKNLSDTAENVAIVFSEETGLTAGLKIFIDVVKEGLLALQEFFKGWGGYVAKVGLLTTAILGLGVALKALAASSSAVAFKGFLVSMASGVGVVGRLNIAFKALNSTMLMNPFVLAAGALAIFIVQMRKAAYEQEELAKANKKQAQELRNFADGLDSYKKILTDVNASEEKRRKSITDFIKKESAMIELLKLETDSYKWLSLSYDEIAKKIDKIKEKAAGLSLQKSRESIEGFTAELADLSTKDQLFGRFTSRFKNQQKDLRKGSREAYQEMKDNVLDWAEANKLSFNEVSDFLQKYIGGTAEAQRILRDYGDYLVEIEERDKRAREEQTIKTKNQIDLQGKAYKEYFDSLTKSQRKFYNELDSYGQRSFLKEIDRLRKVEEKRKEDIDVGGIYTLAGKKIEANKEELAKADIERRKKDVADYIESLAKKGKAEVKSINDFLKLKKELTVKSIEDERKAKLKELEFDKEIKEKEIENANYSKDEKIELNKLVAEAYAVELEKINKKYDDLEAKEAKRLREKAYKELQFTRQYLDQKWEITKEGLEREYQEALKSAELTISDKLAIDAMYRKKRLEAEKAHSEDVAKTEEEARFKTQTAWLDDVKGMGGFLDGISGKLKSLFKETKDWSDLSEQLTGSLINGLSEGLADFAVNTDRSSEAFKEFGRNFLKQISQMIMKALILKGIMALIGSYGGGGGSKFPIGDIIGGFETVAAKGAAFSNGLRKFATGGIVSQPTFFTYDGGSKSGVAGEAGSEAIMPVKRMPNGDLGIQAEGTGNNFNISINVANQGGPDNERQSEEMAQIISQAVKAQVTDILSNQRRSGGMLSSPVGA